MKIGLVNFTGSAVEPEITDIEALDIEIRINELNIAINGLIMDLDNKLLFQSNITSINNTIKIHGITTEVMAIVGTEFDNIEAFANKDVDTVSTSIENMLLDVGKKIVEIIKEILLKLKEFIDKVLSLHLYLTKKLGKVAIRLDAITSPIWQNDKASFVCPAEDKEFEALEKKIKPCITTILDLISVGKWDDSNPNIKALIDDHLIELKKLAGVRIKKQASEINIETFRKEFKSKQQKFESELTTINSLKTSVYRLRPAKIVMPNNVVVTPQVGVRAAANATVLFSRHLLMRAKSNLNIAANIIETNNSPENS